MITTTGESSGQERAESAEPYCRQLWNHRRPALETCWTRNLSWPGV